MLSFLTALISIRQVLIVLFGLALTWSLFGDDSWHEAPLPGRFTVFLVAAGLGVAILVCTGVIWFGSTGLPADEEAQLRNHSLF